MKRIAIAALCLALAAPFMVSAQEAASFTVPLVETSRSTGFEFGNAFEHGGNADADYFSSPGVSIERYSFWNGGNFGTFFHGSIAYLAIGWSAPPHDFQWGTLIGPAFRVRFTDKLTLQTGLGASVTGLYAWYEEGGIDHFRTMHNFGVGADAGLKFDITDAFFIKGGVNVVWSFMGVTDVRQNEISSQGWGKTEKNPNGYWLLNADPYISFGVNIYSPRREIPRPEGRSRVGKPPREGSAD